MVIYVGALAMYFVGKRLKRKYNLKEDSRESLYDACNHFLRQKGRARRFMGGDRPDLADLAVFGVLNSIDGCIAFDDLLQHTQIRHWYADMQEQVRTQAGASV